MVKGLCLTKMCEEDKDKIRSTTTSAHLSTQWLVLEQPLLEQLLVEGPPESESDAHKTLRSM